MFHRKLVLVVASSIGLATPASADKQIERFASSGFTNPFFNHELEFNLPCCWEIVNRQSDWVLHLRPNTDTITFNLAPGEFVESITVDVLDFEGGIVGNSPTSTVIVRAASGDFVPLHATAIGAPTIVSADVNTIGQIFGRPLGEIVELQFQAANQGNSVFPGEIGAFFDDITVVTVRRFDPGDLNCDGAFNGADIDPFFLALGDPANYQLAYPNCDPRLADMNGDGAVNGADIDAFFACLGGGNCP